MTSSPPDGFTVRRASLADAPAINDLITAADVNVQGWSDSSEAELLGWWRMMDLEQSSWILEADGTVAAYGVGFVHGDMLELDGFVHPERRGQGLGKWLVEQGEARARELGKQRMLAFSLAQDASAHRLFELCGMREQRRYYRMMIELDREPAPAEWPDGLHVETFREEDAQAFHDALGEAFEEEWGFVRMPFEEWREMRLVKDPDYDPTLWFVVRDGEEIAAVMRNEPDRSGAGFVGALGVRTAWRKRGLGLALLQHSFGEFHRRGKARVALGVDAENPTGATRLYERAGMHVAYEVVTYGKALV